MYVQGVSTRKVSQITEERVRLRDLVERCQPGDGAAREELAKWRNRPLGCVKYLILDARYEKSARAGCVRDCAL